MSQDEKIGAEAHQSQIAGEFLGAAPCGSGHMNDTYCAVFHQAGLPMRHNLQRINRAILAKPEIEFAQ